MFSISLHVYQLLIRETTCHTEICEYKLKKIRDDNQRRYSIYTWYLYTRNGNKPINFSYVFYFFKKKK
jgi:hypothetical protein